MARRQGERIDEPPEPPREIRLPPREFSVAPTSNGTILDFTNRNDFRTYENGIKDFYDKFDIDPSNLNSFIVAFANKSQRTGWSSIMEIPRDPQDPTAGTDNLLEKYGVISMERVKAWAQRILSEQSRRAQDDNMMYHSLVASLSNEGRDKSKRKDREEDKWKAQNPENLKSKEVKGKVYHWCSVENGAPEGCGCNKFVLHKPETCKGKAWKSDLDSKKAAKRGKALKVQEALTRASNDIGDELYDSE